MLLIYLGLYIYIYIYILSVYDSAVYCLRRVWMMKQNAVVV